MRAIRRSALALALLIAATAPAAAVERVLLFVSDVVVEKNGDLTVTETIRVQAEGDKIRRGIQRDFPTTYTRNDGTRVVVGFDVASVRRDGAPENYTTESMANGVRVRIGQADRTLASGPHEYVIRYRTTRQIGFYTDFDELYWNATGTGWTFAIDVAEARIQLPERVPFRQNAFYTGPQGARGRDAAVVAEEPGRIVFRTTRALPPQNGLTVAAAWQKGIVEPPGGARAASWWLYDNLAAAVAATGVILVVGFYLFAWLRVGRDPPRGTVIPLFGPPAGMSAAAVRYVDRMSFDNRCFTAAVIELGVNGRLRLVGTGANTVMERRDGGRPIGAAEQAMETKLFAAKPSLVLDQVNHEPLGKAKDALESALDGAYAGKLFAKNFGWSAFGFAASLVVVGLIVLAIHLTYGGGDREGGTLFGMLFPVVPIVLGAYLARAGWRRGAVLGSLLLIFGVLVAALAAMIGEVVMWDSAGGPAAALPGVAAYVLAPFAALGFNWLKAPTKAGREVMDQIEGFKEYLGVAEEDRLEALNPPDKTPELFERFLPYAVALDVENTWAKRFAGVLAAAAAGAAAGTASSWYHSDHDYSGDPVAFADHLGSELTSTIASASTPPGSSDSGGGGGSSGGGSSGGGGGGGGGSGW
jgi:uncharacterized membrane protein YgcG